MVTTLLFIIYSLLLVLPNLSMLDLLKMLQTQNTYINPYTISENHNLQTSFNVLLLTSSISSFTSDHISTNLKLPTIPLSLITEKLQNSPITSHVFDQNPWLDRYR